MFKSKSILLPLLIAIIFSSLLLGKSDKLILEKSFKVIPNQSLKLVCGSGDVEITTWDKNEVKVQIYGNRKARKNFKFNLSQNEDIILLEAERKSRSWFNFFSWERIIYKIKVPKQFNILGKTSGGDISIVELIGKIEVRTSGGDINVSNSEGAISTHTSGGDIRLENSKGTSELITSGGDIFCNKLIGDLNAKTSGGDITAQLIVGKVECSTSGGDIRISTIGINKGINASTSGGDISIKVDSATNADIEFRTHGGEINNNVQILTVGKVTSSKLSGKLNEGGPLIKAKTSGGDISLSFK